MGSNSCRARRFGYEILLETSDAYGNAIIGSCPGELDARLTPARLLRRSELNGLSTKDDFGISEPAAPAHRRQLRQVVRASYPPVHQTGIRFATGIRRAGKAWLGRYTEK